MPKTTLTWIWYLLETRQSQDLLQQTLCPITSSTLYLCFLPDCQSCSCWGAANDSLFVYHQLRNTSEYYTTISYKAKGRFSWAWAQGLQYCCLRFMSLPTRRHEVHHIWQQHLCCGLYSGLSHHDDISDFGNGWLCCCFWQPCDKKQDCSCNWKWVSAVPRPDTLIWRPAFVWINALKKCQASPCLMQKQAGHAYKEEKKRERGGICLQLHLGLPNSDCSKSRICFILWEIFSIEVLVGNDSVSEWRSERFWAC